MNIFLLLAMLSTSAPPVKGTLCFKGVHDCIMTSGTTIEVPADDSSRLLVWTREDKRSVIIGALDPKATTIDLNRADAPLRTVRLSVRGQASRGWPAEMKFWLAASKERAWEWTLPAECAGREMTIQLPPGGYRLLITAPHHRIDRRQLHAEKDVSLGSIELKPLPAVNGLVTKIEMVNEEEKILPVMGAQIVLDNGKVATTSNEQGSFRVELPEPLPKDLLVTSPGLGTAVLNLDRLEAENDLGEIRLTSGATLTVNIDRPEDLVSKSLKYRLLRNNEKRYDHTEVAKGVMAPGEKQKNFSDLSAGKYFLVLEGDAELEKLLVPIDLGKQDLTATAAIDPYTLDGRVLFGEEPVHEGMVTIYPIADGVTWRASAPIDAEGKFGGTCWQHGFLGAFVRLPNRSGGILNARSTELGTDPSEWTVSFRKRLIHGRIFDKASGAPISHVDFELRTTTEKSQGYSSVKVEPTGEYEIVAWEDGTYDLILNTNDYIPMTQTVVLSEADESKKVDFGLERGSDVILEFVWPSGQRIAGATIFEGVSRDGHNPQRYYTTDGQGRLSLRVAKDETRMLYVIPSEGSFAPVRVEASRTAGDSPIRIEVPLPTGSLRLHLQDAGGNDSYGAVLVRYNGEWVPNPVVYRLPKNVSLGSFELTGLPSGAYELWAVMPPKGMAGPPSVPVGSAPLRVGVGVGETTAELTVIPTQ